MIKARGHVTYLLALRERVVESDVQTCSHLMWIHDMLKISHYDDIIERWTVEHLSFDVVIFFSVGNCCGLPQ